MRRTMILAGVLLCLVSSAAHAMWAAMRLESVVTQSDLIVVATLSDTRSHREAGMDVVEGPLVVERVIWGEVAPGDTLLLR
ncbi:MAG: hypothetical protein OEY69_05825, partial [Candidatus Krumholzibacteria bacterium]|nr:hypothetical protein [Candidatus Krumholzibacteria bacterium]